MTSLAHTYALERPTLASMIAPSTVTTSGNSAAVDLTGYKGAAVVLDLGTPTGTGETFNAKLQSSPDNTTWTDIPGAPFPQDGTTSMIASIALRPNELPRYVRLNYTVAGTTPSYPVAAMLFGLKMP